MSLDCHVLPLVDVFHASSPTSMKLLSHPNYNTFEASTSRNGRGYQLNPLDKLPLLLKEGLNICPCPMTSKERQ